MPHFRTCAAVKKDGQRCKQADPFYRGAWTPSASDPSAVLCDYHRGSVGMSSGAARTAPAPALAPAPPVAPAPVTPTGASVQVNAQLECPITQMRMTDPVMTADGHTYERTAIAAWLRNHNTSPITNRPLTNKTLVPNHMVRGLL
jgi:hypothetical protein